MKNNNSNISRKRPLIVNSRGGNAAAVPKTGTTLELEAILDGKVNKKKKKRKTTTTPKATTTTTASASFSRFSASSTSLSLLSSSSYNGNAPVVRDTLASRGGGLAAAPSFRVKPLTTNNHSSTNTSHQRTSSSNIKSQRNHKHQMLQKKNNASSMSSEKKSNKKDGSILESNDKKQEQLKVVKPARISLDPTDVAAIKTTDTANDGIFHTRIPAAASSASSVVQKKTTTTTTKTTTRSLLDGARQTDKLLATAGAATATTSNKSANHALQNNNSSTSKTHPEPPPYQRRSAFLEENNVLVSRSETKSLSSSSSSSSSGYVASAPREEADNTIDMDMMNDNIDTGVESIPTMSKPKPVETAARRPQNVNTTRTTSLRVGIPKKRPPRRRDVTSAVPLPSVGTDRAEKSLLLPMQQHNESSSTSSSSNAAAVMDIPTVSMQDIVITKEATSSKKHQPSSSTSQNKSKEMIQQQKKKQQQKAKPVDNDNFVRLNLRNSAGACRGARNKKSSKTTKYDKYKKYNNNKKEAAGNSDNDDDNNNNNAFSGGPASSSMMGTTAAVPLSRMSGLDPIDDYLDGVFHNASNSTANSTKGGGTAAKATKQAETVAIPKCARHDRPCKQLVVKKASTGNKGRKFYVCSMPRGEQCDHFQWCDDTVEAARNVLLKNKSHSGFIARQVASHVNRFRVLTVPELQKEAMKRNLSKAGKKQQLIARLAIWIRDEVAKADGISKKAATSSIQESTSSEPTCDNCDDSVSSSDDTDASDELELFGEESSDDDTDDENDDELQFAEEQELDEEPVEALVDSSDDEDTTIEDGIQGQMKSALRKLFGFSEFRDGQEWAIRRCLERKRTLLVAPTGFGKSLCYALPASLMEGICVVVSPLISLIQDQLRMLPPRIPAATLSGSPSAAETAAIIDDIQQGRIKILFVSPERLVSPSFRRLFYTKWDPELQKRTRQFPEISLLCIDEAHCASHWAHNFRPSFLRFKSLLHLMQPSSVLAITATAGSRVVDDIRNTLGIEDEKSDAVRIMKSDRDNIDVSCLILNSHEERLSMLGKILSPKKKAKSSDNESPQNTSSEQYEGCLSRGSVIVYVWRQKDAEVVAENIIASGVEGGVVVYHGGMEAGARSKSQSRFMRGKARICVATVAFGLGIDKADIVGVIHMYLSSSPEHYIQEIGRAGRDGRQARAISMPLIEEVPVRHSLSHSTSISVSQTLVLLKALSGLIQKSLSSLGEEDNYSRESIHVALPLASSVMECDLKAETLETLLSIIEQDGGDNPLLHVEGVTYNKATIALKKRDLSKLAEKEPLASCISKCGTCIDPPVCEDVNSKTYEERQESLPGNFQRHFLAYSFGSHVFSVVDCANHLGPRAEPRNVFAALRRLQSSNELELALDNTPSGRAIHLKIHRKGLEFFQRASSSSILMELAGSLVDRFENSVKSNATKVLDISYIMDQVSIATGKNIVESPKGSIKSPSLQRFQELVSTYFLGNGFTKERKEREEVILPDSFSQVPKRELLTDTTSIISDLPMLGNHANLSKSSQLILGDPNSFSSDYTALTVAKFLHGIETPRAPMKAFRGHPLFGKWRTVNFELVLKEIKDLMDPNSKDPIDFAG